MRQEFTAASVLARARLNFQNARDSLWFLPAVLVLLAIGLALILVRVDRWLGDPGQPIWWLFAGNADSARTVLSVVAGSLITVVAVAFSVTVIAIQQAANQYSPRLLRNFTSDRGNQLVLGAYIATFVFALLVLRDVREASGGRAAFIPSISVTTAVGLALVSFGLLVYFIHHVTRSLQVSVILRQIGRELRAELEHLFPHQLGEGSREPETVALLLQRFPVHQGWQQREVRAHADGYLRIMDSARIEAVARAHELVAVVLVAMGDFVQHDGPLVRLSSSSELPDDVVDTLRAAFSTDDSRSVQQDPLFAVQQIVDVALRALSPAINDASTAMQCIDQLGNAMAFLLERELPSPERVIERSRVLFRVPSLSDYFDACFGPIRRAARSDLRVSTHLVRTLVALASRARNPERIQALRQQLEETAAIIAWDDFTPREQAGLRRVFAEWPPAERASRALHDTAQAGELHD